MNIIESKFSSHHKESFDTAIVAGLVLALAVLCQLDVVEVELGKFDISIDLLFDLKLILDYFDFYFKLRYN